MILHLIFHGQTISFPQELLTKSHYNIFQEKFLHYEKRRSDEVLALSFLSKSSLFLKRIIYIKQCPRITQKKTFLAVIFIYILVTWTFSPFLGFSKFWLEKFSRKSGTFSFKLIRINFIIFLKIQIPIVLIKHPLFGNKH